MPWPSYLYSSDKPATHMNRFFLLLPLYFVLTTHHSTAQTTDAPTDAPVTAILGAYGEEITLLLAKVENKKERVIARLHFTEGTLNGRRVVVALTGIGKVNAAITTTLMIENFHPAELLFSGI